MISRRSADSPSTLLIASRASVLPSTSKCCPKDLALAELRCERIIGQPFSAVDEPLYRYPLIGLQAQVHSAVGLGVARAALNHVREAGARTGITGAPPLADRAYYRTTFARAYAALHSARSFYLDVADEVWQAVVAGDEPSPEQLARIRLSAANVADVSAQVVHDLCSISGAGIISNDHPMQVLRQDALVPQLHATLGQAMYDGAGAVLMGRPPTVPGFL
ncbi:hypothetical protein [Streptomyces sp. NPDC093991]|uniref:acyl-CoA dehydrogenase family protein n=1 Tax=unclassified Streptomyces TaxID=2593676 RepID=UPI003441DA55